MQKESDTEYPIEVLPNFAKDEYKQAVGSYDPLYYRGRYLHCQYDTAAHCETLTKYRWMCFMIFGKIIRLRLVVILTMEIFRSYVHRRNVSLKLQKGHVNTRPIKGTRKRGETPEEDMLMRTELENSEKDKSELLMIVDLERNDLNRVCNPGSVKVTELFTVEEYATVFHLVSDIEGDLEESKNVMDLLEAAFPRSVVQLPERRSIVQWRSLMRWKIINEIFTPDLSAI